MANKNDDKLPSFKLIWGIMMAFIYLGVAYLLAFSPLFKNSSLPDGFRIGVAIVFSLYGLFRAYRIIKKR